MPICEFEPTCAARVGSLSPCLRLTSQRFERVFSGDSPNVFLNDSMNRRTLVPLFISSLPSQVFSLPTADAPKRHGC